MARRTFVQIFCLFVSCGIVLPALGQPHSNIAVKNPVKKYGASVPKAPVKVIPDPKLLAAEDAMLVMQAKFNKALEKVEATKTLWTVAKAATSEADKKANEARAESKATREQLHKASSEELRHIGAVSQAESTKATAPIQKMQHNHLFLSPSKIDQIGQTALFNQKMVMDKYTDDVQHMEDRRDSAEWQSNIKLYAANDKAKYASFLELAAHIRYMAAELNSAAIALDLTSTQEVLASLKKKLSSQLLKSIMQSNSSLSNGVEASAKESLRIANSVQDFLRAQVQHNQNQMYLEKQRVAKNDYSTNRTNPELQKMSTESRADVAGSLDELMRTMDDVAESITKRTATNVTLEPNDPDRTTAITERADVMVTLSDSRQSLLSAKSLIKEALNKWNTFDWIQ